MEIPLSSREFSHFPSPQKAGFNEQFLLEKLHPKPRLTSRFATHLCQPEFLYQVGRGGLQPVEVIKRYQSLTCSTSIIQL